MKLKEKGRYFEIPVTGKSICSLHYTGFMCLLFESGETLDIHSDFILEQYGRSGQVQVRSKETLIVFYDLMRVEIKSALADKSGNLRIEFKNGAVIIIEDGPYENWHFTRLVKGNSAACLHVHGGVGRTIF